MNLFFDIDKKLNSYIRKGDKQNRRQQLGRIISFARHAHTMGARSLGQIGRRHVIDYWKKNQHLSDRTLYAHWLALCLLWKSSGKSGKPPEPFKKSPDTIKFKNQYFEPSVRREEDKNIPADAS